MIRPAKQRGGPTDKEKETIAVPMKNPPHPGLSVRVDCPEPLGLSVTKAAKALGVSRAALSRLVNGTAGVSPEMAIRLSNAFGSTPESWIRMQPAYNLAQAQAHLDPIKVESYRPRPAAQAAGKLVS